MKHDLTTGTWQDDTGCPISIILVTTSDAELDSPSYRTIFWGRLVIHCSSLDSASFSPGIGDA
jgi:hypothetical protein